MPRAAPRSPRSEPELVRELDALGARDARRRRRWPTRIRHKFRMKNTTGYSLNALVDFDDPIDILAHLMIGSEGTLGFISEITYRTVPEYADKASALILFDDLETACRAVTRAQERAGGRGRARRPRGAALGGGQAGPAGGASARSGRRRGAAGRDARRGPPRRSPRRSTRSQRRSRAFAPPSRCASRPTPRSARASGTCARACSRRSARCADAAPR